MIGIRSGRRLRATSALGLALLIVPAFTGVANGAGQADVAQVRQATLKYRDVNAAIADGYVKFYKCTEQPGIGTMGQHYVKLPLVGDPAVNALTPEVLVYAPKRNGEHTYSYKLSARDLAGNSASVDGELRVLGTRRGKAQT